MMAEQDWEEFKKKVIPLEKKENLLRKRNETKTVKKKQQKEKFEIEFFFSENEEKKTLEKNTLKKIRRGKLRIESKLDLHGFTVEESKEKVFEFILRNYKFEKRLLLIITGKGKLLPVSEGWRGTGKLKENVPLWLRSAQLSKYILWFDSAKPENGGEGALMIYLKKSKNEL